jgi:hypothetical protein
MRPREILNRRKKLYFVIVAASFLAMVAIAYAGEHLPPLIYNRISAGAVSIFAFGVLLVYFGIRCPKCKATLGLKYVFAEETLVRCPRCGINFDEDSL